MTIKRMNEEEMIKEMAKDSVVTIDEATERYNYERKELRKAINIFQEMKIDLTNNESVIEGTNLSLEIQNRARMVAYWKEVVRIRKEERRIEKKNLRKAEKLKKEIEILERKQTKKNDKKEIKEIKSREKFIKKYAKMQKWNDEETNMFRMRLLGLA